MILTVLQFGITAFTAYLLFRTMKLQNQANETQRELLSMDTKAKRAAYMPAFNFSFTKKAIEEEDDDEFNIANELGKYILKINVKVIQNGISNLKIQWSTPMAAISKVKDDFDFSYAYYKKGDLISKELLLFDDRKMDKTESCEVIITLRFEDLVGNKYIQTITYDLRGPQLNVLPLLNDSLTSL